MFFLWRKTGVPKHHSPLLFLEPGFRKNAGCLKFWNMCNICVLTISDQNVFWIRIAITRNPHFFLSFSRGGGQVPACFRVEIFGISIFSWSGECSQCFLVLSRHTDVNVWHSYAGYPCLCDHAYPVPCKIARFRQQIRLLVDSDHGKVEDLKPGKTFKWREERIQYKSPFSWWTLDLQMFVFTPVNRYP